MAVVDASSFVSLLTWHDQSVALKEFASKHPVPNIVKVTKGQYRGSIGVAKSVASELYLFSISSGKKVLVESVKIKDGKATCSTQKYGIPLTYQGWFEVLSENGQAVTPLQTIADLVQSSNSSKNPKPSFLVRETMKAYKTDSNGDLTAHVDVQVGDILFTGKESWLSVSVSKTMVSKKCLSITLKNNDQTLYLPFDTKCKLSPVAGQQNISGVHNIKALLDKFRLPIMVRLVHGLIPTKLEKRFTAVFRLLRIFGDETVFFCPLKKDAKMVPISTREPLKVVASENFDDVKDLSDIQTVHTRCENMHSSYTNSIHVLFSLPEPDVKPLGGAANQTPTGPKQEEDILFEEVEDIYMHVRVGGEPPPPRPRPSHVEKQTSIPATGSQPISVQQPAPPVPKKEKDAKQSSLLGALALKFSRKKEAKSSSKQYVTAASVGKRPDGVQSAPTSPIDEVTTPPPLPEKKSHQKPDMNFDYWEEPIYEPLEKIRNSKKLQEKDTVIAMASSPPRLRHHVADNVANSGAAQPTDAEINTLREVYKHTGTSTDKQQVPRNDAKKVAVPSVKPAKDTSVRIPQPDYDDTDVEPVAPPLPPKNFDITELENAVKVLPKLEKPTSKTSTAADATVANDKPRKTKTMTVTSHNNVTSTMANPLFTHSVTSRDGVNSKAILGLKPSQLKAIATSQSKPASSTTATTESSVAVANKPYMIKNVTASNRRTKGTTVLIEGDSEARISTPPPPIVVTTPTVTKQSAIAVRHTTTSGTTTITAPGVASRMSSYVQAPATGHPPFVAVARVGENYSSGAAAYNNGTAVAHKASVVTARATVQSRYM